MSNMFNVYHYRGDKYATSFNDIVQKSNTSQLQIANSDTADYKTPIPCYALPIDKIVVTLSDNVTGYSTTLITWDFGDGTTSNDLSAIHWYEFPGSYTISVTLVNSSFTTETIPVSTVNVSSYIPPELKDSYVLGDIIKIDPVSSYNTYIEFKLSKFNSWHSYNVLSSIGYNILLQTTSSIAPTIDNAQYESDAYSHLYPYSAFSYNDEICNNIHFDSIGSEYYVCYNSQTSSFEQCDADNNNGVLAGTYDSKIIKYIDDLAPLSSNLSSIISATFDTTGFKTKDNVSSPLLQQIYNYIPITSILPFLSSTKDIVSTNGIINVCGMVGDKFNIFTTKFTEQPINFVFRYTFMDEDTLSFYKYRHTLTMNGNEIYESINGYDEHVANLCLIDENNEKINGGYEFKYNYNTKLNDYGGYLRGSIIFHKPFNNVRIMVEPLKSNYLSNPVYSNVFSVYDMSELNEHLTIFKQNESFNLLEFYKSISAQPCLTNSDALIHDVIGQIVGDASSYNNLGVRIYEKIANFVKNTNDIDVCNIPFLYDMYNKFDEYISDVNYLWPEELNRLIDLLSIQYNKLVGQKNQYNCNFNNRGYLHNKNYGINLGEELNYKTALIPLGSTIVAYEKYSKKYLKLSCEFDAEVISTLSKCSQICTDNNNVSCFALSAYDAVLSAYDATSNTYKIETNYSFDTWGWNLVIPTSSVNDEDTGRMRYIANTDVNESIITNYYTFYKYNDVTPDNVLNSVIDFNTSNNYFDIQNLNVEQWENFKKMYIAATIYKHLITHESDNNYPIKLVEDLTIAT